MLQIIALLVLSGLAGPLALALDVDLEDANLDFPQLVRKYGYPAEEHVVVTSDGYILTMHRIPFGRDGPGAAGEQRHAVFLMHGLMSSSADFVVMGPSIGLGYILADAGFDVWLGNARGNFYSRKHKSDNPNSSLSSFWTFSWEEIGNIDVAAMVDRVLQVTGLPAVHYIGHSQGTTAFFVLGALSPQYLSKFKTIHLMAPIAYMDNFNSTILATLSNYANTLLNLGTVMGLSELFPRGTVVWKDGEAQCVDNNIAASFCDELVDAFISGNTDPLIDAMLPVIVGHFTAGSSLKQFAHFGQVISSKQFRRWSFTLAMQNLITYGRLTPPAYDVAGINSDIYLHYSTADSLAAVDDVTNLYAVLPRSELRRVPVENFSHFDFAWGSKAKEAVYDFIIDKMNDYDMD